MRVAITNDRFETAATPFVTRGLTPVHVPCVRVVPTDDLAVARNAAAEADLLVVTSARTVEILWDDTSMPPVPVVAVGEATAGAVSRAGGNLIHVGEGGLDDLVEVVAKHRHAAVVFPHGAIVDEMALHRLRAALPRLTEHVVYRTLPVPATRAAVDGVVFGSPSAVAGWLSARDLDRLVVGVIGETTARSLPRLPEVVSPRPSWTELADAFARYVGVAV
ncbi:MAG: uroporphyrinogen-III synthase [Actinobacteria bacterium]|nr:uroporphyrinogen-III synthase [Actinomycetota bacterium]